MNEEGQIPGDVMMKSIIDKMKQQDQRNLEQEGKLSRLEGDLRTVTDHSKEWKEIRSGIQELMTVAKGQGDIMKRMDLFIIRLDVVSNLFRHPPEGQTYHHHHFPKIAWITIGLLLAVCILSSGWYMTAHTAYQHLAGDIKYRKLKLLSDTASLRYLWRLDSIYLVDPGRMEKEVEEQEQLKQHRLELIDQLQAVDSQIGQDKKTGRIPQKGK